MKSVMICAGEASGDLHAGALTKALLQMDKSISVFGMGGDCLKAAGGQVVFDIKEHSVMGFAEVICKLPALFKLKDALSSLMDERRPCCLVVIDYPDFNMKIAKIAHSKGIPVVYFIGPSVWIWRKGRAKQIASVVDTVAAIFPFERDVYLNIGANVDFVGHPLVDIVQATLDKKQAEKLIGKNPNKKAVLLLPGSRLQEIKKLLPPMLQAAEIMAKKRQDCDFYLLQAPTIPRQLLEEYLQKISVPINIITGHSYDIMNVCDVAMATSGTVTLEAALCNLPSVIIYKTSPISAFIARCIIKVDTIGLPNIVAGKKIFPELLQEAVEPENIASATLNLLDEKNRAKISEDLAFMKEKLGRPGAVKRVANIVIDIINRSNARRAT